MFNGGVQLRTRIRAPQLCISGMLSLLRGDRPLQLLAQPADPQPDRLPRLQVDRCRLDTEPDAGRRAGGDDIAGLQAHAAAQIGDELSDAKARQAQLKKQIADQKAKVAAINDLQNGLAAEIRSTKSELKSIGADLAEVRRVLVHDGSRVEAGEALVELDDTRIRAEHAAILFEWRAFKANEARLRSLPAGMQSSMLKDALAGGAVELDAIAGPIIGALGRDGARATVQAVSSILAATA